MQATENSSCETRVDITVYLQPNDKLNDWSRSAGTQWLAGSLPWAAYHFMCQEATNLGFLDLCQPKQVIGLQDAVGGLFLRICSLLPTKQLAAHQGWLKNFSAQAKWSFAMVRMWSWGAPRRARWASTVRGQGRTPLKRPLLATITHPM